MRRLLMLWEGLSPEVRQRILDNYPWILAGFLGAALAGYFGLCKCRKADKPKPADPAEPAVITYARPFPGAIQRAAFQHVADDDPAYREAYREALKRAEQRWRERAMRKASAGAAGQSCPDCCGCGRCGTECPCLATGRVCGTGCCCVVAAADATAQKEVWERGGVEWDKVQDERSRIMMGKREISRAEAMRLVEGDVPDDAAKLRLTIIGSEADRKRVLAALDQPPLAEFKGRFVVQAYDPNDWAVKNYGFVTSGKPTIYVQMPSGKVLHRQDVYTTAEDLATALRKADPGYDPKKDPDARKPALPWMPDLSQIPMPVWIGGALVLLMIFGKKGGQ